MPFNLSDLDSLKSKGPDRITIREIIRKLFDNPRVRAFVKMRQSRGVLEDLEDGENIAFIPEAVIEYGYGHLPTPSDPEGLLYTELPAVPGPFACNSGWYLFRREEEPGDTRERLHQVAEQVYEESGRKGIQPSSVEAVLARESGMQRIWVEFDPHKNLDEQFRQFKKKLTTVEKRLYGSIGTKRSKRRETARDTLIYTLRESAGMKIREIARKIYSQEYSQRTAESLEARVRQNLHRTRSALRANGITTTHR